MQMYSRNSWKQQIEFTEVLNANLTHVIACVMLNYAVLAVLFLVLGGRAVVFSFSLYPAAHLAKINYKKQEKNIKHKSKFSGCQIPHRSWLSHYCQIYGSEKPQYLC